MIWSALGFGAFDALGRLLAVLGRVGLVLIPTGATGIAFLSSAGALAQSRAAPEFRGRVAALFAVAFLGEHPDRRTDRGDDLAGLRRSVRTDPRRR